ncbi:VWA domain-containing protein [Clostridium botulinum]|uniref:VWA domain-containing protein n=1 Tax=Clostridium TaxID=1485 RepID=UPI0013F823A5|nr:MULTISPECIES: vWA domain-containing protein [Clostridium]MCS6132166.1 VWA domain-containing protein [Clostridium botulinum]NFL45553.1 VWA domain-containing protein [Clostridium botulinum]NFL90618.1 VWA domain-containing protein [Clostridium botulinum]
MRKIKSYMAKLINTKKRKDTCIGVVSIFFIVAMISGQLIAVNAIDREISDKPSFDVEITSVTPENPVAGEDILVRGQIIPKPFETKLNSQKKRIVLVLDVSGSMNDVVSGLLWWKSTKLDELKDSAKKFINKMKNIPNIEIAIVSYSNWGEIEQTSIGNSYATIFHDISYEKNISNLEKIIDNLGAHGGTNTGDGLRKAEYALENYKSNDDKYINKSIVFMTDGMPTFYCTGPDEGYYTEIDRSNHNLGGNGREDWGITEIFQDKTNLKNSLNYAKKIGNIIKNNQEKRNVYSIGYGTNLNVSLNGVIRDILEGIFGVSYIKANDLLEEIHESMGGKPEDFYITNDNAIQGVFNNIADKIIDSYDIKNININMSFNENFTLNLGGNSIKVDDIKYVKKSEHNGIVRYEADPIEFSFVIKAKNIGKYNLLDEENNYIEFDWEKEKLKNDLKGNYVINISNSIVPNINAIIDPNIKKTANSSDTIDIRYNIDTPPFEYNIVANTKELVVNDAKVYIDLGENYDLIENNTLKKVEGVENQYILELPEIRYTLSGINNENNNKIWKQSSSNNLKYNFKIKKKHTAGYGALGFGSNENNKLVYTSFSNDKILKTIETPVITYKNYRYLSHGIYNGASNGIVSIRENTSNINFVRESSIYLGAIFNVYNGSKLELNIEDAESLINGDIKIKKINSDGEIVDCKDRTLIKNTGGKYTYEFKDIPDNGEDIIVIYNEIFNEINKKYTNTIKIDDMERKIYLNVGNNKMPELF